MCNINPLSSNIHLEILDTDLYMFPWKPSWESLLKEALLKVIILVILITFSHW